MAKYEQNASLRDFLLETGTRRIGEASQSKTWGIGIKLHQANQLNISKWTGANDFGHILQEIRESLRG